jgi:hypothetical protein
MAEPPPQGWASFYQLPAQRNDSFYCEKPFSYRYFSALTGSLTTFVDGLAIHVWRSLGRQLETNTDTFDNHANDLVNRLRSLTIEFQRAQTTLQRIQHAAYLNGEVAVLEYYLLWGRYGYNKMVERLMAKRPFEDLQEALQISLLPLRYCVAMELKTHVARYQGAVRQTYVSERSVLIHLAREAGISLKSAKHLN